MMNLRINDYIFAARILAGLGSGLVALAMAIPVHARFPASQLQLTLKAIVQIADRAELLQPLHPIEKKLKGDQSHDYLLKVDSGAFFRIDVDQRGIDVLLELDGPDGKKLTEVDSPNGISGLESLVFIAGPGGTYKIRVRSLQANVAPGKYVISLSDYRPAAERERRLLALHLKYREALDLQVRAQLAEAQAAAHEALKMAEENLGREHPETALVLITVAEIERANNRSESAAALFRRALETLRDASGSDRITLAQAWEGLGNTLFDRQDLSGAERCYQQAISVRERVFGKDSPDIVILLGSLAQIYLDQGDLERAELHFKRARNLYETVVGTDNPAAINFLNNYAGFYCVLADYSEAEKLYQQALAIQQKILDSEHPDCVRTIDNLAGLYYQMGDTEKAGRLREEALKIQEKVYGPAHPMVALALSNLGVVFYRKGDLSKAEALYLRALKIYEEGEFRDHPNAAAVMRNLANVRRNRGDLDGAESLYRRAININRKAYGEIHPDLAATLNGLSSLASLRGNLVEAESLAQQALKIQESVFGLQHPDVLYTLGELASLNLAQGKVQQAIELEGRILEKTEILLRRNLVAGSERQKLAYLSTFANRLGQAATLHTQYAPADPQALNLALTSILRLKGRGLDEIAGTITNLRSRAGSENEELLKQWLALRSQFSALALRGPADADLNGYVARRREVEERLERTETALSRRSAEFRLQTAPVTSEAVQALIPPGTSLIEYLRYLPYDPKTRTNGSPHYAAYVINSTGAPHWAELGEATKIDRAIERFCSALHDKRRTDVRLAARRVDQLVMQPLRELIGDSSRILISPDGQLNLVPFAALADEHRQWLVTRYSFSYLTSGRDLLRLQAECESRDEVIVVADPAFGGDPVAGSAGGRKITLSPRVKKDASNSQVGAAAAKPDQISFNDFIFVSLPGTAREAQMIKEMIPAAKLLTGPQASKQNLSEIHRPRILHIATHGFFLNDLNTESGDQRVENPLLRSGLALAGANFNKAGTNDGVLTALEAAGLDLLGTKLVVLSACDTGVGEIRNGDGVYGLRRALVLAGSETQIMTLWPVSDSGTQEFMTEYYSRLLQGIGRGEALRQAQLEMIKRPQRRHPFYWAGLIQSGAWAPL